MEISLRGRDWLARDFAKRSGHPLSEEEVDRRWTEVTRKQGPAISIRPEEHVREIVDLLPRRLLRYFIGRPWVLVRFSRRRLVTCDTPLALIPAQSMAPGEGAGVATARGILSPLTRDAGLLMADPLPIAEHTTIDTVASGSLDHEQPPSTAYARLFNQYTILNARRFVFHHPDDAHLVPADLPEPQMSEMELVGGDFVEMGERMRAHQSRKQSHDRDMPIYTASGDLVQ